MMMDAGWKEPKTPSGQTANSRAMGFERYPGFRFVFGYLGEGREEGGVGRRLGVGTRAAGNAG
jgi:hypothetical protein